MTISFSSMLLTDMGFRRLTKDEDITAAFYCLQVYAMRGAVLDTGTTHVYSGTVDTNGFRFAIGNSVNAICGALTANGFTNDEPAWQKEKNCLPPYVVIQLGPTAKHRCVVSHLREDADGWVTLDSFTEAKKELRSLEQNTLPQVVTAISSAFFASSTHVRLTKIDRAAFGITDSGKILHDLTFSMNAAGYLSTSFPGDVLEAGAKKAALVASRMNARVSRFFQLALDEEDTLKQFLYFFLSIEIQTHAEFQRIDHAAHISTLIQSQARLAATTVTFFLQQRENWKTLRERFMWCAHCVWTHISDADVEEFLQLKKIRDDIAHGNISNPPPGANAAARTLALKILQST